MKLKSRRLDVPPLTPAELKTFVKSRSEFEKQANLQVTKGELNDAYREEILEMIEREPDIWKSTGIDYLFYTLWLMGFKGHKTILVCLPSMGSPMPTAKWKYFSASNHL